LVEALPSDGLAVLNADDPLVAAMVARTSARTVLVGESPAAAIRAGDVELDELTRPSFRLETPDGSADVRLQLAGRHQVGNALAAAAVALACGMTVADVAHALAAVTPVSRWRMELSERADGVLVINDAYNANPESMRAALETLAQVGAARSAGARTFAVLGHMAELGDEGPMQHEEVGRLVARLGIDRVLAVGEVARPIALAAALESSWSGEAVEVPDVDDAVNLLRSELRPGDVVLVKASRAASLERVAQAIADDTGAGPAARPQQDGGTG
jgi:UDP-N-acetylmuramoyl-tripeptide--D-alanyl-D-alanine ligase